MTWKQLNKGTMGLEQDFIKSLTNIYDVALTSVKKEIGGAYANYAVDGKLSMLDMAKFDRLKKLEGNIAKELGYLSLNRQSTVKKYLGDVYGYNYDGAIATLDKTSNLGLDFGLVNRKAVAESILSPLSAIALEENQAKVVIGIRKSLAQGIAQGLPVKDMAKLVQKSLEGNANNATRIVRTETTRIMNTARQNSFDAYADRAKEIVNIEVLKVWSSTNDGRTRDWHASLQGEQVGKDEPFSNGLMFPGDPSGDAADVVNCRCAMRTIIKIDGKEL